LEQKRKIVKKRGDRGYGKKWGKMGREKGGEEER